MNKIQDVFSQNRAEEFGYDVWENFVIPHYYQDIDFKDAKKPRVIIGGRGCGKTMLLRYISHQSQFSPSRKKIPISDLSHIGLYWRADTQFCNIMIKRDISEQVWQTAFNHFAALLIAREILASLFSIEKSSCNAFSDEDLDKINFDRLKSFDIGLPENVCYLYSKFEDLLWEFETWVSNVGRMTEPRFYPGPKFIKAVIDIVKRDIPVLKDSIFYVYVDEFENLTFYQKRIINTWLKHSEAPLIFNLAMKKKAFPSESRITLGDECLSDIHDYRKYDIEDMLLISNFNVFAAEILLLQLSTMSIEVNINVDDLRKLEKLQNRKSKKYEIVVMQEIQKIFPDISYDSMAKIVFRTNALYSKLKESMIKALAYRGSDIEVSSFLNEDHGKASIINAALLYRKNITPEQVKDHFEKLINGKDNNYDGKTAWVHNNFVGCLLQLYAPYSRACPFYAGFKTFCQLSVGNVRHLLELCHNSVSSCLDESSNPQALFTVPYNIQAEAARKASNAFLHEIKSFGSFGEKLFTFVLRIGSLFQLANSRYTQSESEISHFSLKRGSKHLDDSDELFLSEAIKWSVLIEHKETKKKEDYQPESMEYVLNPIYSPYFHISYRKKRKLEISTENLICLIRGSVDEYTKLIKYYKSKWAVQNEAMVYPLFNLLDENK